MFVCSKGVSRDHREGTVIVGSLEGSYVTNSD